MHFIITLIILILFQSYFVWWSLALVCFICAYVLERSAWKSFLVGFLCVFLLWLGQAYYMDIQNESTLSQKVSILLGLPSEGWLLFITALLGGLMGGLSSLSGFYTKSAIKKIIS